MNKSQEFVIFAKNKRFVSMKHIFYALLVCLFALCAKGQSCDPQAVFVTIAGEELSDASSAQNAPLEAHFTANPDDGVGKDIRYEWKIWNADDPKDVLVHRFEENIDYTFVKSGAFLVQLYATFTLEGDTITWPEKGEENPITVVISSSKLEMPNAFSPNGDGYNDIYNAKPEFQSIVSFKATIFNRWGQAIYSWTNPDREQDGWDGTWNGNRVHDGVYFVRVVAQGADGRKYNIRKDVNVLTGYDNGAKTNGANTEP